MRENVHTVVLREDELDETSDPLVLLEIREHARDLSGRTGTLAKKRIESLAATTDRVDVPASFGQRDGEGSPDAARRARDDTRLPREIRHDPVASSRSPASRKRLAASRTVSNSRPERSATSSSDTSPSDWFSTQSIASCSSCAAPPPVLE